MLDWLKGQKLGGAVVLAKPFRLLGQRLFTGLAGMRRESPTIVTMVLRARVCLGDAFTGESQHSVDYDDRINTPAVAE